VISFFQLQRGKRFIDPDWSSQARPVLELVHGLEAYGSLIVGDAGAGHPAEEGSVFDEGVGVGLVAA